MGTGYTRQSSAGIVDGLIIEAADFNAEFNQIEAAFSGTTGHSHDGTTGEGIKIDLTTSVTGILPVANGGLGASLDTTDGNFIVANGSGFTVESGSTARDSLDLGTSDSVSFGNLEVSSSTDGQGAHPYVTLKRLSPTPANSDQLGQIQFRGANSASESVTYATITGKIVDVTDASEDGKLSFDLSNAGTLTEVVGLTPGTVTITGDILTMDDLTYDLGSSTGHWNRLWVGYLDNSSGAVTVGGDFIPETDGTFDLGTSSVNWSTLYVNLVDGGTELQIAGTDILVSGDTFAPSIDSATTLGSSTNCWAEVHTDKSFTPWISGLTRIDDNNWQTGTFSTLGTSDGKAIGTASVLSSSRDTTASGQGHVFFYNPNGFVGQISTSGSTTAYSTSSDGKLKTNRISLQSEIDIGSVIDSLNPVAFDWLSAVTGAPTGQRGYGLIAQEVKEISELSAAVADGEGIPGEENFVPGALDYSHAHIIAIMIAELKSLRSRVSELEAQLNG